MKVSFAAAYGKNDFSVPVISPVQKLLPLQLRSKGLQDKAKFPEGGAHFTLFE